MSLEAELKANTEALKALTAQLTAQLSGKVTTPAAPPAAEAAKPVPAPAAVAPEITHESLKKKILALAAKDEPKAQAIMAKFGGKLPATKPEQYAALDAELDVALSPVAAPAGLV